MSDGEHKMPLTVIATTGDRFSDFAPYVASVNDAGVVAFQAALRDGGTGVFTGDGGPVAQGVGPPLVAGVTSHPDINGLGALSFYGEFTGGGQGVFLVRDRRLSTLADTGRSFAAIGPLGPTMNEAGAIAFRGDSSEGVSGVYVGNGETITTIADTQGHWSAFHGLPVINGRGIVVFRADRKDGVQGVYAARAGSVRTVVESGETFAEIGQFPTVNDHGTVAFVATRRSGEMGILVADGDDITEIDDTDSAFESYRGALISGAGGVIRIATLRSGNLGLFSGPDPVADRILAIGDPLFGSTVIDFAANPVSVSAAGHLAIRVSLKNGRQLILRVDPIGGR
jgi:hypothetical protein